MRLPSPDINPYRRTEMDRIMKFFKKQQLNAPVPRNYPSTAGMRYIITWMFY